MGTEYHVNGYARGSWSSCHCSPNYLSSQDDTFLSLLFYFAAMTCLNAAAGKKSMKCLFRGLILGQVFLAFKFVCNACQT